ncbi:MAG: dihydroorotate dehydrogenase (quinone) [Chloroflexi bacterium GWB2_49_20]|nr:MAG: dihydroorotate dehydrogenase (quinone) [Chloroflexi bacterium GWB2_49_20]OGN77343.1 MAG: dihydroorotate dehydrogenase (quinone) [Chloroflexi bacterium GWC2_49_37]OGN84673.1 MAG: dihydroorotate dehydrogenase (quinone) [Chloroflexi bacterium GWD2_49_16]HBG74815.1 dihydroorotate dehydrogenase (quinone) [Anaerolineae bacterium]HCC77978.1 dihydroorotate dehydrogenase (quinone) [Anaerolineae bacterium]
MYKYLRPVLFRLDPENAHSLTLNLVRLAGIFPLARWLLQARYAAPDNPVSAFGLTFKNPIGLAAGYDKDGVAVRGLAALGFGHIEVGTVTPRPQPGNPRPRIFRLVEDQAVINRMGFPGRGADFVTRQLAAIQRPSSIVLGVNLGKNKDTPLEEAAGDYIGLMHIFAPLADYLTINISSPNTVGLRRLQGRQMLNELLGAIARERISLPCNIPVLVKLAPDLEKNELEDALEVILATGMDGIVATNTTLSRPDLKSTRAVESGGLSGTPLQALSLKMLEKIVRNVGGRIPVVSVGGVMTPADADRRLQAGATLVQVYTGLIFAGPGLIKKILTG